MREPGAVEEPLQLCWHRAPPGRIDDDHMLGPPHILLEVREVGLELLDGLVTLMQDGVEVHLADVLPTHLVAGCLRMVLVTIREGGRERRGVSMPEEDVDAHGKELGRIIRHPKLPTPSKS